MLDPEGLAQHWVPGSGKPLVRVVARGLASTTYSVRRDGLKFAMRLPRMPPASAPPGAASPWHQRVYAAAAAAGLGPRISACDPLSGILITEWVRGRCWTRSQAMQAANSARIATLMRRIHALSLPPPRYAQQPAGWIRHYGRIGGAAAAASRYAAPGLAGEAARRLAALARLPRSTRVLCHSDLHRLNLLDGPAGLLVLDWEYAHYSDPFWDLAGWLCANDLGEPHRTLLLAGYLGRAPGRAQTQRLACLMWLYDYVCVLWSDAHRGEFTAAVGAAVERRARLLAARLQRS